MGENPDNKQQEGPGDEQERQPNPEYSEEEILRYAEKLIVFVEQCYGEEMQVTVGEVFEMRISGSYDYDLRKIITALIIESVIAKKGHLGSSNIPQPPKGPEEKEVARYAKELMELAEWCYGEERQVTIGMAFDMRVSGDYDEEDLRKAIVALFEERVRAKNEPIDPAAETDGDDIADLQIEVDEVKEEETETPESPPTDHDLTEQKLGTTDSIDELIASELNFPVLGQEAITIGDPDSDSSKPKTVESDQNELIEMVEKLLKTGMIVASEKAPSDPELTIGDLVSVIREDESGLVQEVLAKGKHEVGRAVRAAETAIDSMPDAPKTAEDAKVITLPVTELQPIWYTLAESAVFAVHVDPKVPVDPDAPKDRVLQPYDEIRPIGTDKSGRLIFMAYSYTVSSDDVTSDRGKPVFPELILKRVPMYSAPENVSVFVDDSDSFAPKDSKTDGSGPTDLPPETDRPIIGEGWTSSGSSTIAGSVKEALEFNEQEGAQKTAKDEIRLKVSISKGMLKEGARYTLARRTIFRVQMTTQTGTETSTKRSTKILQDGDEIEFKKIDTGTNCHLFSVPSGDKKFPESMLVPSDLMPEEILVYELPGHDPEPEPEPESDPESEASITDIDASSGWGNWGE